MKKKLKVLALFDAIAPTTIDQDLSAELKTVDWKTEANVLGALQALGHTIEHQVHRFTVDCVATLTRRFVDAAAAWQRAVMPHFFVQLSSF